MAVTYTSLVPIYCLTRGCSVYEHLYFTLILQTKEKKTKEEKRGEEKRERGINQVCIGLKRI